VIAVTNVTGESLRLLLVDSQEDTAATLRTLLRARNDETSDLEWISNAAEGLRIIDERRHDVYLIDRDLDAAGDGALLKAVVATGCPPLVLLGGHRDARVESQVLASGAADFLWKEELSAPLIHSVLRHAMAVRDRVRLERQLHLTQRMETIGRLAGGIAHEFNNILTAIIGFGSLLAERVTGDEAAAAQVQEILGGADRASTLTRDLLAFSRRQVLRPTRLDPTEVVEHLARMLRGVLGSQIRLHVACAADVPAIHADRAQLEQAITSLVISARDAMTKGGDLTIELDEVTLDATYCTEHVSARPGRHVRLAISDTGAGIAKELLPRVFEPFFTAREAGPAAGLGLSTVYGIVKQSGGNIWAYSEPGLGTTFKLYFPCDGASNVEKSRLARPEDDVLRGTETILLVDDTAMVRRLARDVLSTAGYRVLEAGGADEALQVAGSQAASIDLLLTDVVMPGHTGIELADRLRNAGADLRVLYISGYTDAAIVRGGLLGDDAAFLEKPFTPEDLLRKVRQVLE
jgi:two-component system cell cycle sensor histidine kinase/response regulator CckA